MKVGLDDEPHYYAQKADVVNKEDQDKEYLPTKRFISMDNALDK